MTHTYTIRLEVRVEALMQWRVLLVERGSAVKIMVPTDVCLVCQRVGIPVTPYEVRSGDRAGEETLCAEHAVLLEQILTAGRTSDTSADTKTRTSAGTRAGTKAATGTRAAGRHPATKQTATKQTAGKQRGTKRAEAVGPKKRGRPSTVMSMEEIEALRETSESKPR